MPDFWDSEGNEHPSWSIEATEEEVMEAAAFLITAVEPEASDQRVQMIARLLKMRDYTRAELLLVMRELPFDSDAAHNYGRGLNPADVERIIQANREIRAKATKLMSSQERDELIAKCPDRVDPDDFHLSTYNSYDEPLWAYNPGLDSNPRQPRPKLEESTPGKYRSRDEDSGDILELGPLLDRVLEDE